MISAETIMEITSERIDDIPVIVEWRKLMEIAKCIDQKLSEPQVNHKGRSLRSIKCIVINIHHYPVRPSVECCGTLGANTSPGF
jgi:hypothetical protein